MPVLLHMGPAAPCGLTRYESTAFGDEYRDNLFACYFNLHKVSRHVLTPERGDVRRPRMRTSSSSPDLDFHPTDVIEDADGSLIVVDTGGWYKLCCPTSQLHKPDVLGGVYRVRRKGRSRGRRPARAEARLEDDDAATSSSRLLDDPRPAVRHRAIETLAGAGRRPLSAARRRTSLLPEAVRSRRAGTPSGPRPGSTTRRRSAVIAEAPADPDETVRQAAIHSASLRREPEARLALIELLARPLARRTAGPRPRPWAGSATVGRARAARAPRRARGTDRILEHSLTYALIEIGDPEGTAGGPRSDRARESAARPWSRSTRWTAAGSIRSRSPRC